MTQEIEFHVSEDEPSVRIDKYLAERMRECSRSRIQQLIEEGAVSMNGRAVPRVSEKIAPGAALRIHMPDPSPSEVIPEDLDFNILYEDEHIVGVNKPAGLTVHPTASIKTGTLVNGLLYRVRDLSGIGGVLRPGIVHRLDRVTSGVLVIAKTDEAHRCLCEQFKSRRIRKIYWAVVHGLVPRREGEIDQPIGRHSTNRKLMTVRPDGRRAVTQYKVLKEGGGGTLLELNLLTGRTHQIRVHLKHLGIPIVGDRLYGIRKYTGRGTLESLLDSYPGIALHSKTACVRTSGVGEDNDTGSADPGYLPADFG